MDLRWLATTMAIVALATPPAGAAPAANVYAPWVHLQRDRPHPAVVRVIVPEGNVTSFGSGTLVDVRDQFGLVITNWHVVRDGKGEVEVVFPDGFRSKGRPLKVDADWDLAALVIWRPPAAPVPIAPRAPQSGDQLTICGYGRGQYRAVTGRCTQYYAPKEDLPQHMVELDVEARQGDSGGPIFNDRGELAGVLFGAGGGTTLGSFGGRVESFLASLAPDIGQRADAALVQSDLPASIPSITPAEQAADPPSPPEAQPAALWTDNSAKPHVDKAGWNAAPTPTATTRLAAGGDLFEQAKTVLAAVGVVAILLQVLRAAR
jgi:hypothetical protein